MQEVRQPHLTARADEEIRVGNAVRVEGAAQAHLVDLLRAESAFGDIARQSAAGIDDLVPRPVVEGHEQVEARVGRGRLHHVVDATLHFGGHPIRTSDHAEADAARHELR
jgi:hypothetical protein